MTKYLIPTKTAAALCLAAICSFSSDSRAQELHTATPLTRIVETDADGANPISTVAFVSVRQNSPFTDDKDDNDDRGVAAPKSRNDEAEEACATDITASCAEKFTPCKTCKQPAACCDSCCGQCGPRGQYWLRQEYLGWWATPGHVPTLVTTSPNGTLPATTPLYGDRDYNGRYRSGLWSQAGMWLDDCQDQGLQGDFIFIGRQSSPFNISSNGDPVLARPFTDATTGLPAQQLVAFPNTVLGSALNVQNYNSFYGAGGVLRQNLYRWTDCCDTPCDGGRAGCFRGQNCGRLDLVGGFRYFRFNDNLGVSEQVYSIDPTNGLPVGAQFNVNDSFRTQNNFYGGEIGAIFNRYRNRWMYETGFRVALGSTQQSVSINGNTVASFPGLPTTSSQGGLLALSSNIGNHTHNSFSAIPQFSGRLGFRVTERLTLLAGYTAIYWDHVARAGDQIDTRVNPNLIAPQIPGGPNRPSFTLHTSDLLLQGVTLGGEYYF